MSGDDTRIRRAVTQTAGQLVVTHLAKIIVGLGALLALVWQLRGDLEERERRIGRIEDRVERVEQHVKRLRGRR